MSGIVIFCGFHMGGARAICTPATMRTGQTAMRSAGIETQRGVFLERTKDHRLCPHAVDGVSLSTSRVPCHSKSGDLSDRRVTAMPKD